MGLALSQIVDRYEPAVMQIIAKIVSPAEPEIDVMPEGCNEGFNHAAQPFVNRLRDFKSGLALVRWAEQHLSDISACLGIVYRTTGAVDQPSLMQALASGKQAAAEAAPVVTLRDNLLVCVEEAKSILLAEEEAAILADIQADVEQLKSVGKYAISEVERTFEESGAGRWNTSRICIRTRVLHSHRLGCT